MNSVYRCVCALCMLFTLSASVAQESKVDSLKSLLEEIEYPIEKTNLYNNISVYFYFSQVLYNFGLIQTEMGETNLAIENYLKALFIFERLKDSESISIINSSIAALYFAEEKYDKAITFFNKAIEISTQDKDSTGMAIDYANLGETEYKAGKYLDAQTHLKLAKKIARKKGMNFPSLDISFGNTLFALRKVDSAIIEAKKGLSLSQKEKNIKGISEASELLYRIAYSKENYKEALMHYKRFEVYKDSVSIAKSKHAIEMLKLNAKIQMKEEVISRMEQKTTYMNIIYVLVGIGIILLVFLVSRQIKVYIKDFYNFE